MSRKANKGNNKVNLRKPENREFYSYHSPVKVWAVRIVVVLLCVAVAVTLIPTVFF